MVTLNELKFLLPEVTLALGAVIVMLAIAAKRNHLLSNILTLAVFGVSFFFLATLPAEDLLVGKLFVIDPTSRFMTGLMLCSAFIITLYSFPYFKIQNETKEEYYILLILATLGSVCMTMSDHFVSFVISLEVLSVSLFGLIGYLKKSTISIEAAIKYLIMAAVATAFILFGFALIYSVTGKMDLMGLSESFSNGQIDNMAVTGLALVIVGFGFKMALTPFHLWTPDIYSAAPSPVAAFVATISKGAAFIFLMRLFYSTGGLEHFGVWITFVLVATASMFIGNWLGLRQQNLKRLLAYSSISHLGYLMVGFLAVSHAGIKASVFYLVIYFTSILAAFGMITYLTGKKGEPTMVEDYRGLFWTKPWLAAFFTLVMLSLAGIPLTAGFMGKFYLLTAGMAYGSLFLLIVLVVSTTIGLYYYLRVVAVMLSRSEAQVGEHIGSDSFVLKAVFAVLFVLILWMGVYPNTFFSLLGM
ncbi:MAG TPA: NADH-quinone oxidoreductase subunit N [Saprospiraceae bacterium]|nr:NADH-quinone oxidoreductase subunit N [Saprospiraceae bacterium]HRN34999.1 NADH-quinone oxidoreductase subunit N [Saprospiraceae bacterium]HRP84040.1 NADH-quinone oxidoreductase subunit N [Saprospiraceae bacterium]